MNKEEIMIKVIGAVAGKLNIKPEKIQSTSSFVDDLGADSLDQVEIIMSLEDEFDIGIPDNEAEQIKTIQEATDYILKNI